MARKHLNKTLKKVLVVYIYILHLGIVQLVHISIIREGVGNIINRCFRF